MVTFVVKAAANELAVVVAAARVAPTAGCKKCKRPAQYHLMTPDIVMLVPTVQHAHSSWQDRSTRNAHVIATHEPAKSDRAKARKHGADASPTHCGRLWWVDSHSQGAEGAMGDNRAKQRCKRLCWQLTI